MTEIMTPDAFLELAKKAVEDAKENDRVFILGHMVGDIDLGQASVDDAVSVRSEIAFPNEAFSAKDGDVRPMGKLGTLFHRIGSIPKEELSDMARENIRGLEEEEKDV